MSVINFPGGPEPHIDRALVERAVALKQRLIAFATSGPLAERYRELFEEQGVDGSDFGEFVDFTDWIDRFCAVRQCFNDGSRCAQDIDHNGNAAAQVRGLEQDGQEVSVKVSRHAAMIGSIATRIKAKSRPRISPIFANQEFQIRVNSRDSRANVFFRLFNKHRSPALKKRPGLGKRTFGAIFRLPLVAERRRGGPAVC